MTTDKTAIWAITPNGVKLAGKMVTHLEKTDFYLQAKLNAHRDNTGAISFDELKPSIQRLFHRYHHHVFIFATGIAVRVIAPLLESKLSDPSVTVVDDSGQFSISLVSGHLGGGNEKAMDIARIIGALPVITTATDVNRLPAIDMIAKKSGVIIETPDLIKSVNMSILSGKKIILEDKGSHLTPYLNETFVTQVQNPKTISVVCTDTDKKVPRGTMLLRPKTFSIGIGCNRDTSVEEIWDLIALVFRKNELSVKSIRSIGTIDIKMNEKGISEVKDKLKVRIDYYTKAQLNQVKGVVTPSAMAQKHTGAKNVCEAAAILSSLKGNLIIPKQKSENVTLAVAR